MLLSLIMGKSTPEEILLSLLLTIPTVLIALSFHEFAHGWAASKLGDPTAKNLGRLTLNPFKHFSLVGSLLMLLVGFGWAKPVPINTRYFKNPKKGMAISAAAGPLMNLLLAFIGVVIYALSMKLFWRHMSAQVFYATALFFSNFCYMNVFFAVFNLLPIPPFDGSRLLFAFLPDKQYFAIMKYENVIMIVVLVGLATGILDLPFEFIAEKILSGMEWLVNLIL